MTYIFIHPPKKFLSVVLVGLSLKLMLSLISQKQYKVYLTLISSGIMQVSKEIPVYAEQYM